MGMIKI